MSESHFQSLYPSLVLQRPVGANLGEALEHLLDQALSHQFPKHPKFGQEIRPGRDLKQVLEVCQQTVQSPEGRVFVEDRTIRQKLRNICNPLDLGQMSETHFVLGNFWKNHFNRLLAASDQPHPTAADLRRWMNQPEERGLPREIQNLLILVYADQTNRSFVRFGGNYVPSLDDLPNELELREQTLPDLRDWEACVTRVADIMGHAISKLLNASNLASLAAKVGETLKEFRPECDGLPDRLQLILKNLNVGGDDAAQADRVKTAKAVKVLLTSCDGKEPTKLVETIAHANLQTNSITMGRSLKSARDVLECLRTTRWDLFSAVARLEGDRAADAAKLNQDVVGWLKTDEHALAGGLTAKLSEAEGRAIKLLTPPPPPDPPDKRWSLIDSGKQKRIKLEEWSTTSDELNKKLSANPRYRLTIDWTIEEGPQ